ncbi:MAG: hypothetical protein R3D55_13220 [Chloroflexota bacterium]
MLWKILRPYFWMADRQVRATRPVFIVGPVLLLVWGGEWLYRQVAGELLGLFATEAMATAVATFLPTGLFIIVVFTILGFGDVLHQLYLAADVELLLTAPISDAALFGVKLLQCSRAPLLSAVGVGSFFIMLGLAQDAPLGFFGLVAGLILLLTVLATAVVIILAVLLARWLPGPRLRYWIPLLVTLLTFVLLLIQPTASRWFLGQAHRLAILADGLLNLRQLGLFVLGLGGLTLLVGLTAFAVFRAYFHESWNRYRLVPVAATAVSPTPRRLPLFARLPSPWHALWQKEWRLLRRNPRGLLNLLQPLVLVAAVLVLFRGVAQANLLVPLRFYALLAFLALFLITQPVGTVLLAVAEEGRNMALLRSLPLPMKWVLGGKFWAAWGVVVLSWTVVLAAAGVWLGFTVGQIGVLLGTAVWGVSGVFAATTALGGLWVNFQAEDVRQRTPAAVSYLTMGLNAMFASLTSLTALWLVVHLLPANPAALALRGLTGFALFHWLFADSVAPPLALAAGQLTFWLGVGLLWRAAVQRLERLEIG